MSTRTDNFYWYSNDNSIHDIYFSIVLLLKYKNTRKINSKDEAISASTRATQKRLKLEQRKLKQETKDHGIRECRQRPFF